MTRWRARLHDDPLPWLLHPSTPAVRHLALRQLLGRRAADPQVVAARCAAMAVDPIASILAAQHPEGYWEKPGPGYATKYRGTVWQLIFLDQLGADPADERVRRACAYVLAHSWAATGGFGASGRIGADAPCTGPESAGYGRILPEASHRAFLPRPPGGGKRLLLLIVVTVVLGSAANLIGGGAYGGLFGRSCPRKR